MITPLTKNIKRWILLTDIESRYLNPKVDELLDVASFLDSQFKTEHICLENMDTIKAWLQAEGMGSTTCILPVRSADKEAEPTEVEDKPPSKKTLTKILKKKRTMAGTPWSSLIKRR